MVCYVFVFRAIRQSRHRLKSCGLKKNQNCSEPDSTVTSRGNEIAAEFARDNGPVDSDQFHELDPSRLGLDCNVQNAAVYPESAIQCRDIDEEIACGGASGGSGPILQLSIISQEIRKLDSTSLNSAVQEGINIGTEEGVRREENVTCEEVSTMHTSSKRIYDHKLKRLVRKMNKNSTEKRVALTGELKVIILSLDEKFGQMPPENWH